MPCDQESAHLTLAGAAAMLGMAESTLERWARDGRIPSALTREGVWVFRRSELLDRAVRADAAPDE